LLVYVLGKKHTREPNKSRDVNQQATELLGKTNTFWIAKLAKLRHIDDLTNAAAKRNFLFDTTFWRQDVIGIKIVASSCPASSRSCQAVLLHYFFVVIIACSYYFNL